MQTQYSEPCSPWENGYCESFNGKLRDKLLDGEMLMTLQEATVVIESQRQHYNHRRPHRSLNGRHPAPLTVFTPPQEEKWDQSHLRQGLSAIQTAEAEPQRIYH